MNASEQIIVYIDGLADWRGKTVAHLRKLILAAAPDLVEEWKWSTPVWSHNGNVVATGVFKDHVRLNFFQGAKLQDPNHLFNAGLEAKSSRGIDVHQGDNLNEAALKKLIRDAVALNSAKSTQPKQPKNKRD